MKCYIIWITAIKSKKKWWAEYVAYLLREVKFSILWTLFQKDHLYKVSVL
jgi:hypothetical protein